MGKAESCCCLFFIVYFVGFVAFILGAASPRWYPGNNIDTGIFFACDDSGVDKWNSDHCSWIDLTDMETWYQAAAGLMGAAVLLGLIALCVAMFIPVTAVLQILAGALGISGSTLWMVEILDSSGKDFNYLKDLEIKYKWGFIIAVVGAAIMFINGICLTVFACWNKCHCSAVCCCCPRKSRF